MWIIAVLAGWTAAATATSLEVSVARADGKPVPGAVVLLHETGARQRPPGEFIVDQVDQSFTPDLTVIPVGSSVRFPNSDRVSHQVYSFSPARRFQLPLYRGTPYAPIVFDRPGIVTLGCNIHDDMIAYLVVTDAGWFGRTDGAGNWIQRDLPPGDYRVEVWHPRMRESTERIDHRLTLAAQSSEHVDFRLTKPLRPEALGRKPRSWSDY